MQALRRMDALYIRLQENPAQACRFSLFPHRQLIGSPVIAWEFNTVPEFNYVMGRSEADVSRSIQAFRHYARGCDLAICVSQSLADYVQENLGIQHVLTVPNGSDPELFRPDITPVRRIERNPDRLNVVWMGSADLRWQNFDLLRSAAELLWQRGESARVAFHLIGRQFGMMRDMPPNIHYYGAEDYRMLPHWLAAMDVGLCMYHSGPADYGSPLKLFDYMASGLAVVATYQPQIKEVFEQLEQTDLIVPSDEPAALADTLVRLAQDHDRVYRLGQAGRQLVIDYYNWRRVAQDITAGIQKIIDSRH